MYMKIFFNLLLVFFFFSSLGAIQEKDLFPKDPSEYLRASVWYDSKGNMYIMFGSNIIAIDSWHYPEIDDDED